VEQIIATYKIILRDHLSVRALEELIRRLNKGKTKQPKKTNRILDEHTVELEKSLQSIFGATVSIARSNKGGKITIPFKDDKQLNQIMATFAKD